MLNIPTLTFSELFIWGVQVFFFFSIRWKGKSSLKEINVLISKKHKNSISWLVSALTSSKSTNKIKKSVKINAFQILMGEKKDKKTVKDSNSS